MSFLSLDEHSQNKFTINQANLGIYSEVPKLFNEKREEILGSQCKSTLNEKLNKLARELGNL